MPCPEARSPAVRASRDRCAAASLKGPAARRPGRSLSVLLRGLMDDRGSRAIRGREAQPEEPPANDRAEDGHARGKRRLDRSATTKEGGEPRGQRGACGCTWGDGGPVRTGRERRRRIAARGAVRTRRGGEARSDRARHARPDAHKHLRRRGRSAACVDERARAEEEPRKRHHRGARPGFLGDPAALERGLEVLARSRESGSNGVDVGPGDVGDLLRGEVLDLPHHEHFAALVAQGREAFVQESRCIVSADHLLLVRGFRVHRLGRVLPRKLFPLALGPKLPHVIGRRSEGDRLEPRQEGLRVVVAVNALERAEQRFLRSILPIVLWHAAKAHHVENGGQALAQGPVERAPIAG